MRWPGRRSMTSSGEQMRIICSCRHPAGQHSWTGRRSPRRPHSRNLVPGPGRLRQSSGGGRPRAGRVVDIGGLNTSVGRRGARPVLLGRRPSGPPSIADRRPSLDRGGPCTALHRSAVEARGDPEEQHAGPQATTDPYSAIEGPVGPSRLGRARPAGRVRYRSACRAAADASDRSRRPRRRRRRRRGAGARRPRSGCRVMNHNGADPRRTATVQDRREDRRMLLTAV
jgi:hypothetical protein